MKKEIIECKSKKTAIKRAPWACVIKKVEGGYIAFESATDWQTWKNQK